MPTPTPTSLIGTRMTAVEAAHTEAAEANRQTLANAASNLAASAEAVEASVDLVSDIEAALVRATGEFTASDLAAARAEVEVSELAHRGTQARIDRARLLPVNTQTDAALALVPLVQRALPGVPVIVTAATTLPDLTAADAPLVILSQLDSSVDSDGYPMAESVRRDRATGGIRRTSRPVEVQVQYLRSEIHREVDLDKWNAALRGDAFRGVAPLDLRRVELPLSSGSPRQVGEGLELDAFKVKVGEPAPVPAVVVLTDDFTTLAARVGAAVADSLPAPWIHDTSTTEDSSTEETNGIRTVHVTGTTKLREAARPGPGAENAPGSLAQLIGSMVYGAGRIVGASHERVGLDRFTWTVTLTSRVSYETPHPTAEAEVEAA